MLFELPDSEAADQQTVIQSLTTAGSAVGALCAGPLLKHGRRKFILLLNLFIIVGSVVPLFKDIGFWPIYISRFIYGIGCGAFLVFSAKYICEVSPTEIQGPAGCITQISLCLGILLPFFIGSLYECGDETQEALDNCMPLYDIGFIVPIIVSVL